MTDGRLMLDYVYEHAAQRGGEPYLTQPLGGGRVEVYSWSRVVDEASRMAAHLRSLGFEPGARIAMLSKNCAHFIIGELAIWMAGHTTVAIFPTETAETVRYVLEHSEANLLFVGKLDIWPQQQAGVPAALPIVTFPLAPPVQPPAGASVRAWDDIVAATAPLAQRATRRPDDLAMIMYTSGSTGQPKGVMTTFEAITRVAEGVSRDARARLSQTAEGRILSYLPLAHSFERTWVEASSLVDGRTQVFFAESLDTFLADLQRARPTMFISVPRLWQKFQQGVFAKMPPKKLDTLLAIPIVRGLVARKIRASLGLDAVVAAGSGSAPIPAELIAWYRRIGLRLFEGYGMTEDNSYSFTSNEQFSEPGYVGVPMPGVQARLSPEGEILIKSPGQLKGYYKRPDLDAQAFTEDGFFRTGDLGEMRADGLLRITGRAKEQFKTSKGEYVAPAPIENRLNVHPMIELSMVAGAALPAPYAIVVLAEDLRPRLTDPAVREDVERQMRELLESVNREQVAHARLKKIVIAAQPWTIENGLLTPTMKIRRARIEAAVAAQIERWYGGDSKVEWA